jgi:hypothetical protein
LAAAARARQRREARQKYNLAKRPVLASVSAIAMIIAGILSLTNSYLILASLIISGWLIVGVFGIFSIVAGAGLLERKPWSYTVTIDFAIVDLFVGFIAFIGAFDPRYSILGWTGIGQGVGIGIFIMGIISLICVTRPQVRHFYEGFV